MIRQRDDVRVASFTVKDVSADAEVFVFDEYIVRANRRSCFGCTHCTDIWYDYTNGPYMFHCDRGVDEKEDVLKYGCDLYEEE